MSDRPTICLNRFLVHRLDDQARTVHRYSYSFTQPPDGPDIYRAVGSILYKIGDAIGARLESEIVTTEPIVEGRLQGEGWTLKYLKESVLDPKNSIERKALEQLNRRYLYSSLKKLNGPNVERSGSGFVLWDEHKIEGQGDGWQVLRGALIDIVVDEEGLLSLEIDSHYRFFSPWTVQQCLDRYPNLPLNYLRNVKDGYSWYFVETSDESPGEVEIKGLGKTLKEYHLSKGVTEQTIKESKVVYVRHTTQSKDNGKVAHLSQLLLPSVSMEILSYIAEQGDTDAARMLREVRKPIRERLSKGTAIAKTLIDKIYGDPCSDLRPQQRKATQFKTQKLIARNNAPVSNSKDALKKGCLQVGETNFGCLYLQQGENDWPETVKQQLISVAKASGVTVNTNHLYFGSQLPDGEMAHRRFWSEISESNVKTMLIVSEMLGQRKTQLRREALQAGIALQFMRPMPKPDHFRAANITLGLLVKAAWQPVGMKMPNDPRAAELVIGFDAGTNKKLFYGTSAFAVVADGQSLGWEIPEAQPGERFSGQAILNATLSIVERFQQLNERLPRRILLLRDGFVRDKEFDITVKELNSEGIAVDLLEVHKSGAGRMARLIETQNTENYEEVIPGTGFSISDDAFRIVTSRAIAGGSARPLEVVKLFGDASLELLANEVFALSQFHPASAFGGSRLPMPLHYADKMIKEVQRMGEIRVLYGVDRRKIFAA